VQQRTLARLSAEPEVAEDSVADLSDTNQALEAAAVEGIEDAADHRNVQLHTPTKNRVARTTCRPEIGTMIRLIIFAVPGPALRTDMVLHPPYG
jgi:hypothetical protein